MNLNDRNPMCVGMVYRVIEPGRHHVNHGIKTNDIILCLEHTGDCQYIWVLLKELSGNYWSRYFSIEKVYEAYTINVERVITEKLTASQMIKCLSAFHFKTVKAALLINKSKKNFFEGTQSVCPLCNEIRQPLPYAPDSNFPTEIDE